MCIYVPDRWSVLLALTAGQVVYLWAKMQKQGYKALATLSQLLYSRPLLILINSFVLR